MALSRQPAALLCGLTASLLYAPAAAQEGPPGTIDLLAEAREAYEAPPETEPCDAEQDAATIAGEIVVCRRVSDGAEHRLRSAREARSRYATATMDAGDPRAPDQEPKYPGPVVARGCFIGPCPKPRAIVTDFAALPDAPPGSDADRIAQGLAPLGEEANSAAADARIAAELALPPPASIDSP